MATSPTTLTTQTKPWETPRGKALTDLLQRQVREDVSEDKWEQLQVLRRNQYYRHGVQNLIKARLSNGQWEYVPAQEAYDRTRSFADSVYQAEQAAAIVEDFVINFYRGDGKKFESVIGAQLPQLKAVPERRGDDEALSVCPGVDALWQDLAAKNDAARKHSRLASSLFFFGTTFIHTPYVANGKKYGWHTEIPQVSETRIFPNPLTGELEEVEIPVPGEPQQFPKGMAEIRIADGFTVTTVLDVADVGDAPWLLYEYEVHKATLFAIHPEIIDDFLEEDTEAAQGANIEDARDSQRLRHSTARHQSRQRKNRLMYGQLWLRPEMFFLVKDEDERTTLLDEFPEGCKITLVNNKPIKWEPAKLDDEWVAVQPESEETLWQDSVGHDFVPLQDAANDIYNKVYNLVDKMAPKMLVDEEAIDLDAIRRNGVEEFIPFSPLMGKSISDVTRPLDQSQVPTDQLDMVNMTVELGRNSIGINEGLWSGANSNTAREADINQNAAIRQLNIVWDALRRATEKYARNLVMAYARNAIEDEAQVEAGDGWDLEAIAAGAWRFESDPAMPQTWGQVRDYLMGIINSGNPMAAELAGVADPANLDIVRHLIGIPGLRNANADMQVAVAAVIAQLIRITPEQMQMDPMGVQQVAPINPFVYDPMLTVQIVKNWTRSKVGQRIFRTNPFAFGLVQQWGQQYEMISQQMAMQAQMGMPPGAPPQGPSPDAPAIPPMAPPPDVTSQAQALANPDIIPAMQGPM